MKKEISKKEEDWLQKKWRPMMAVMYMIVCIFDFVLFPVMFTVVQFWETEVANDAFRQWQPITLLGGGLFHVAMGAVLGVTAWSRGQEKIAGAAVNIQPQQMSMTSQPQSSYNVYANTMSPYQDNNPSKFDRPQDISTNSTVYGYKGKKAPLQDPDPVL